MIRPIERIREIAQNEEIDYNLVLSALADYTSPRDAITRMLKQEELIRVKKGLYVFGPRWAKRPYSLEILANLVYGPSYVSREFALQHYQMIPEQVIEVTSMTTKRNRIFFTPVGRFTYRFVGVNYYKLGV